MGGMETLLGTLCPESIRGTGPCSSEGWMWKSYRLGSLALLFGGSSYREGCAGDGGGEGHGSTGLAEMVDAPANTLCPLLLKSNMSPFVSSYSFICRDPKISLVLNSMPQSMSIMLEIG